MNEKRTCPGDASTRAWTMTGTDFWSLVGLAVLLLVALTGGSGTLDVDRLKNAARSAAQRQVAVPSPAVAAPVTPLRADQIRG